MTNHGEGNPQDSTAQNPEESEYIDTAPRTRKFVLNVLRGQSPRAFAREIPNEEIPEGEHNWRGFELDFHTHMIPEHFSGCFKCGAMLTPRTPHWKSAEKARRLAPPCPGITHPEDLQ